MVVMAMVVKTLQVGAAIAVSAMAKTAMHVHLAPLPSVLLQD